MKYANYAKLINILKFLIKIITYLIITSSCAHAKNWSIYSPNFRLDIWHSKNDDAIYYDIHYMGKELSKELKELNNNLHKNNWHQLKSDTIVASEYKYYHLTLHCNTESIANDSNNDSNNEVYFNTIGTSLLDKGVGGIDEYFTKNNLESIKDLYDGGYERYIKNMNHIIQFSTISDNHSAHTMSIEELAKELNSDKHKPVVFVVGAGMSAAGGIMTLVDFYAKLGLEPIAGSYCVTDESMLPFLHNLLSNNENKRAEYDKIIHKFCVSLDKAPLGQAPELDKTTRAHKALHNIYNALKKEKEVIVYSGNFDSFLENAGVTETTELEANKRAQSLKSDNSDPILVMLGLSADHGGIISTYKQHFPNAKVFMLNLKANNIITYNDQQQLYSLDIDGYVLGDLQKNLPDLAKILGNPLPDEQKPQ